MRAIFVSLSLCATLLIGQWSGGPAAARANPAAHRVIVYAHSGRLFAVSLRGGAPRAFRNVRVVSDRWSSDGKYLLVQTAGRVLAYWF